MILEEDFSGLRKDIDLKEFQEALQKRLEAIESGQADKKDDTAPLELDQARTGRLSRMDAMQQKAMSRAASRLAEQERRRIYKALERMKDGDYGYCVNCDEEIAEGRLRFDPSVATCIECARKAEK
jgi:DnaK suppressor protein